MGLSIDAFLGLYSKKGTIKSYKRALRRYMEHIYQTAPKTQDEYNALSVRYLAEGRDHRADLRSFAASLHTFAPKTASLYFSTAVLWLSENGIDLPQRETRRIISRLPKGGAQTRDDPISHEFLREIFPHLPVQGRALVLLLSSSGMRISEALGLTLADVDLSASPCRLTLPGRITKTGAPRTSYISGEARIELAQWLQVRDRYLVSSQQRNAGLVAAGLSRPRPLDDPHVFPFSVRTAQEMWVNSLTAAGQLNRDPDTGRLTRSFHGLRKFYLSQSKLVIPAEIPEMLAGHSRYLSDAYRRYSDQELADYYHQAEAQLTILAPPELRELTGEFRQKMEAHSEILQDLVSENLTLKKRLESIEELQAQVSALSAVLAKHPEVLRQ